MASADPAAGLTVREALELPSFAEARVVAGREGLDRVVQWAHIVDIPDASYAWDRPGVLLLTAGFGMRDDLDGQAELVPKLAASEFAGLVLSTGYAFERTPESVRQAADAHRFPIIEMPSDVLFIELTEAIFGQLINHHYALLQDSNRMHAELTGLALRGGGLEELAAVLARQIERSVTIEDPALGVLATARRGAVDEARERSVQHGRATAETSERLVAGGLYHRMLERMEPVHVPPEPDLGMTMERIVAPIIVDRQIHGYIWVIAGDGHLTEIDSMAIVHGATVAALIMLREQSVREAEASLHGDLLERLVSGGADPAALEEQAHRLGVRVDRPLQVLAVQGASRVGVEAHLAVDDVSAWLRRNGVSALAVWRDELLVVLLHGGEAGGGAELAGRMIAECSRPARRLLIGVGEPGSPTEEGTTVADSYEQAREALRVRGAMGQQEGVAPFSELGLLHWLYRLPAAVREGNPHLRLVRELAAEDADRGTDLLGTLESYLEHGGGVVAAAGALYVHRNTLLHRLARIEERTGLRLRDPAVRLQLHVAVVCYRLHAA